jgi:hypothetical protein
VNKLAYLAPLALALTTPAFADDGPWAKPAEAPSTTTATTTATEAAPPAKAESEAAEPAGEDHAELRAPMRLAGDAYEPVTRLHYDLACLCVRADAHVALDGTATAMGAFPLDRTKTPSATSAALSPRARVSLVLSGPKAKVSWQAEYEQDLPTGNLARTTPDGLAMPETEELEAPLRKASLKLVFGKLIVGGGVTTSHWGLGLVANDGAHDWEPGSARFADHRGGDRVLRAFVATGPYTPVGLVGAFAAERVLDDDALLRSPELGEEGRLKGDTASAVLGTVTVGLPTDRWAGAYVAYRSQEAADGRKLHITAFDVSAIGHHAVTAHARLMVGVEAAYLRGDTTLAPTVTHTQDSVGQLGVALRSSLDLGRWGAALDGLVASGDNNLDDGQQHGFRANHNFDFGFILFPQVLAAQSARGVATASNPNIVGEPVMGVERIPTRGGATNTIAVFPRAFVRPAQGLEVYGGPLLAWAATGVVDPFNTTIAGGTPTNALGGTGGSYLGTELDVGARGTFVVWGAELAVGVEAGMFLAGSALHDAMGTAPAAVKSARLMVGMRL